MLPKYVQLCFTPLGLFTLGAKQPICSQVTEKPNIVIIYADDLGYGDVSCYGATKINTPAIDLLARQGLRFTNAHSTSATSTPSRYSMLTGEYAWRRKGTGVARGDAAAIIQPGRTTIPSVLKNAGYTTAAIGKWHLGLGPESGPDWNGEIAPGPKEIGFDYHFLIPATGDRVPCVYVENGRIVDLDPCDPVQVSFNQPVGKEPTGKENPELLRLHPSHGHDQTIINGISRIGYMSGGKAARWNDEKIAERITEKAKEFIRMNKDKPFFLYFCTHDIHVPRIPDQCFAGKSGLGPRGDVILQFDWTVGEILKVLDDLKLMHNTIVILTSDNGPVVDDGYKDQAVEKLNGHIPAGPFRGGKYSAYDGGTRVPFVIQWDGKIIPGVSNAALSQIDLLKSFADLTGQILPAGGGPDSYNELPVLLGKSEKDRDFVIEHSASGVLSIIMDSWKYIEPGTGPAWDENTSIELGNDLQPQLFYLGDDPGEKNNIADAYPEMVKKLAGRLQDIREMKK
jgi:arylsulfatase A-like enzyme